MDRDSLPSFADPVAGPAIQSFLSAPNNATSILSNLQAQATSLWATNG
jgi:multiple sugar transport system substrate-binding protein